MLSKSLLFASASLIMLSGGAAQASEQMSMEAIQEQLKQLSSQVQALSSVVDKQNKVIAQQKSQLEKLGAETAEALENISPAAGGNVVGDVKITMKPSPKIESTDGKYSFQPFGRVHLDVTQFDDDKFDRANNANLRRARLGAKGNIGEDLKYKLDFDFAEENVNLKSMHLTYTGLDAADIRIGNQKPSFGMSNNTSSNYIMLMERDVATNAFTRSEELGVNILGGGDNWSLAAGIFNEDAGNSDTGEDEDVTFDARGSVNLLGFSENANGNVLHLGTGYSHRRPTGNVKFKAKPSGDGASMISTGNITSVDNVDVYNLELAAVLGPFSFQSEYFNASVSRSGGNSDADFDGYYAQVGWFITGESRPYKGKVGNFGRIKPKSPFSLKNGGIGAWEVLARYENADLNDVSAGITGGELNSITAGINWNLNSHVRFMANIVNVDTDNNAVVADDDPTVYNFRAAWDF